MLRGIIGTKDDYAALMLRLMLGIVFFVHGSQMVLGWFGGYGFVNTVNAFTQKMHIPFVFALLAIAAEFLGSIALLMGLFTRVAALSIGIVMVVAVGLVHWQNGFFMNWSGAQKGEGFEYHLLVILLLSELLA